MSSVASGGNTTLFLLVFLILIILLRIRRVMYGTRISVGRTVGYSIYYVLFGALVLSSSFFVGIPTIYFVAYPVVFVSAFVLAFELAKRRVVFWKNGEGSIFSKGGLPIYVIYVVGLVTRIIISFVYNLPVFGFTPGLVLTGAAIQATVATDLLLIAGIGLLFGRNMRILRKYLSVKSGKDTNEQTQQNSGDGNPSMPA